MERNDRIVRRVDPVTALHSGLSLDFHHAEWNNSIIEKNGNVPKGNEVEAVWATFGLKAAV